MKEGGGLVEGYPFVCAVHGMRRYDNVRDNPATFGATGTTMRKRLKIGKTLSSKAKYRSMEIQLVTSLIQISRV